MNTVDGFQGREKDVILFSCVRSAGAGGGSGQGSIGFLDDLRRMNVALTRARHSLFVVGSADSLSISPHWTALLDHCATSGAFLSVPDPGCSLMALPPPEAWDPDMAAQQQREQEQEQQQREEGSWDWSSYGMGDMIAAGGGGSAAAGGSAGSGGGEDEVEEGELEDTEEVEEHAAPCALLEGPAFVVKEEVELEVEVGPQEDAEEDEEVGAFEC